MRAPPLNKRKKVKPTVLDPDATPKDLEVQNVEVVDSGPDTMKMIRAVGSETGLVGVSKELMTQMRELGAGLDDESYIASTRGFLMFSQQTVAQAMDKLAKDLPGQDAETAQRTSLVISSLSGALRRNGETMHKIVPPAPKHGAARPGWAPFSKVKFTQTMEVTKVGNPD